MTTNLSSNSKAYTYEKQRLQIRLSGNENQVVLEDCQFRLTISGNGNRIMIITKGQNSHNAGNHIQIRGNGNYVGVGGGKLNLNISGNGNEIEGEAEGIVVSSLSGFGNLIPEKSNNKMDVEPDSSTNFPQYNQISNNSSHKQPQWGFMNPFNQMNNINKLRSQLQFGYQPNNPYKPFYSPNQNTRWDSQVQQEEPNGNFSYERKKQRMDNQYQKKLDQQKTKQQLIQKIREQRFRDQLKMPPPPPQQQNSFAFGFQNLHGIMQQYQHPTEPENILIKSKRNSRSQTNIFENSNRSHNIEPPQNNHRNRQNTNRVPRNQRQRIPNQLQPPRQNPSTTQEDDPLPLQQSEINRLPQTMHHGNPINCQICLQDIAQGDQEIFLLCFHSYHNKCISAWMLKNCKCPFCFSDVRKQIQEAAKYSQ